MSFKKWLADGVEDLKMMLYVILGIAQIGGIILLFTTPRYGISILLIVGSGIGIYLLS